MTVIKQTVKMCTHCMYQRREGCKLHRNFDQWCWEESKVVRLIRQLWSLFP